MRAAEQAGTVTATVTRTKTPVSTDTPSEPPAAAASTVEDSTAAGTEDASNLNGSHGANATGRAGPIVSNCSEALSRKGKGKALPDVDTLDLKVVPAKKCNKVVDPTGAGNAFMGGLAAAIRVGCDIEEGDSVLSIILTYKMTVLVGADEDDSLHNGPVWRLPLSSSNMAFPF